MTAAELVRLAVCAAASAAAAVWITTATIDDPDPAPSTDPVDYGCRPGELVMITDHDVLCGIRP